MLLILFKCVLKSLLVQDLASFQTVDLCFETMDGPSNFVVDYSYTTGFSGNFMFALYWKIGGQTYHINNPSLLKEQWPQDRVVRRRWHISSKDDPGFRVVIWQSGWQDWNLLLI